MKRLNQNKKLKGWKKDCFDCDLFIGGKCDGMLDMDGEKVCACEIMVRSAYNKMAMQKKEDVGNA